RVVALQRGRAIFNLSASFHVEEEGLEHQFAMPETPDPESLPTFEERMAPFKEQLGDWYRRPRPIDQRFVDGMSRMGEQVDQGGREPRQQVWVRADGRLPDDPLLHACVVAYASDMTLLDSALLPHDVAWDDARFMGASLDHAMWFHRPFRADEWLLYSQDSPTAYGARALSRGMLFTRDGRLAVSVVQEGLVRLRGIHPPKSGSCRGSPTWRRSGAPWARTRARRRPCRAGGAGRSWRPGPGARASGPASPRCGGWRRGPGTCRWGSPWPGR